jgi:hypothetical protein
LAAAYLGGGEPSAVNFIKDRIRRENRLVQAGITRKLVTVGVLAAGGCLLIGDLLLAGRLQKEKAVYAQLTTQVDKILPSVKQLLLEKEAITSQIAFLQQQRADQQLYLQALALISKHKPAGVTIKEFDSKLSNSLLEIVITGASGGYEQVNIFLSGLKKEPGVYEPKVVASTFPGAQGAGSVIDFKLRFEVK